MLTAALLGAYHGINPAMGWLFAVFLALHRGDRRTLLRALVPIAIGHAAAVGIVAAVVVVARSTLPVAPVRYASGAIVLAFGIYRLVRYYRHLRWRSLNVSDWDLAVWSFLAATSHGSGLMLAPLLLGKTGAPGAALILAAHSAASFVVMALVALLVYGHVGIAHLRKLWLNFDLAWALALVLAGGLSLLAAAQLA